MYGMYVYCFGRSTVRVCIGFMGWAAIARYVKDLRVCVVRIRFWIPWLRLICFMTDFVTLYIGDLGILRPNTLQLFWQRFHMFYFTSQDHLETI